MNNNFKKNIYMMCTDKVFIINTAILDKKRIVILISRRL